MFIHDQRNAIVKGVKQGRTEGRTEGLAEGLKQGANQTKIAIAQRLLTTLDDATIARITDLTLDEVKQLRWSARAIKPNE